jgi:hypothetical protein
MNGDAAHPQPKTAEFAIFRFHEFVNRKSEFSACLVGQITGTGPPSPRHHEGRLRDRHGTWRGLRWTLRRQAVFAARRNARSVRRSRVVLAPRPWRLSFPACAGEATVTKNAAHRGEHEVSRKAIARGKPGCLGCTCLFRVRSFYPCTRHCGCIRRPAFPAPSVRERDNEMQNSGENAPRD